MSRALSAVQTTFLIDLSDICVLRGVYDVEAISVLLVVYAFKVYVMLSFLCCLMYMHTWCT